MLDDLRKSASQSFIDDIPVDESPDAKKRFLGMTAPQRFLVAVLLLIMTVAIGTLLLLAFGKISL